MPNNNPKTGPAINNIDIDTLQCVIRETGKNCWADVKNNQTQGIKKLFKLTHKKYGECFTQKNIYL